MNETKTFNPSIARTEHGQLNPSQDVVQYLKDYARERPDVAALWCFGIGFVLGWKLKPW
ncbi:MAG: hypothetical protein M3552_08275 [Planctomycetota bacterium]|nr:hypothetical protein [Planctomycetaceae bacterium]MDQ3330635.1 hypothetical protein [Planctomycetota bacterium]